MLSPVIVALDKPTLNQALELADSLDPALCRLKVGKELFTTCGVEVVNALHSRGFELFLDLKFHDIPNTTAQAVLSAAQLGVWMTNIHASVGLDAMALCKHRLISGGYDMLLIAVTVLTSMTDDGLQQLGINRTVSEQVLHLAKLSSDAKLDGVVCSAQETTMLRNKMGTDFTLVTPGIRLSTDDSHDQKRICTPNQAIDFGSDYLVIGRSIIEAKSPNDKLRLIVDSLKQ